MRLEAGMAITAAVMAQNTHALTGVYSEGKPIQYIVAVLKGFDQ